jgi:hypothetical protein
MFLPTALRTTSAVRSDLNEILLGSVEQDELQATTT